MKKPRFLCIAPYEGMYHLMTNIAAQRDDVELVIQSGNLDDGLKTALDNRRGIDAVISRGGTADVLMRHLTTLIDFLLPRYMAEGKANLIISVGCTGGKHRSITFARKIAEYCKQLGYQTGIQHRDAAR